MAANDEYQDRVTLLTEKCSNLEHDITVKDNENTSLRTELSALKERCSFNEAYTKTLEKALEEIRLRKS